MQKIKRCIAACGSCFAPVKMIFGEWDKETVTFKSKEFTGAMNGKKFWDDLRALAKESNAMIELYKSGKPIYY